MTTDRAAVSTKTAAEMYDISEDILRAAIDRRELPAKRIPGRQRGVKGTAIRIDVAALRDWFQGLTDAREAS